MWPLAPFQALMGHPASQPAWYGAAHRDGCAERNFRAYLLVFSTVGARPMRRSSPIRRGRGTEGGISRSDTCEGLWLVHVVLSTSVERGEKRAGSQTLRVAPFSLLPA